MGGAAAPAVVFREGNVTWRLGSSPDVAVVDTAWAAAHDACVASTLSGLGALGSLPAGEEAKSLDAWKGALEKLRVIESNLATACSAGVKPERAKVCALTDCWLGFVKPQTALARGPSLPL